MSSEHGKTWHSDEAEAALRASLERGDTVIVSSGAMLRHFLANEHDTMFSDEVQARVRGMITHLALQFLVEHGAALETGDTENLIEQHLQPLGNALVANPAILAHIHALAMEFKLVEQLQRTQGIDPVLSPLAQELIASQDEATSEVAMTFLASQARYMQAQRRMEMSFNDLPAELFQTVMLTMRTQLAGHGGDAGEAAHTKLRKNYDERRGRMGLLNRLVHSMGDAAVAAVSMKHAGGAIFLSALAQICGHPRDIVALTTAESQTTRLALTLRAAGLEHSAIAEQFSLIHPEVDPLTDLDQISPDRALAVLATRDLQPHV